MALLLERLETEAHSAEAASDALLEETRCYVGIRLLVERAVFPLLEKVEREHGLSPVYREEFEEVIRAEAEDRQTMM